MGLRPVFVAALMLSLALSGCSGGKSGAAQSGGEDLSGTHGTVVGLVVDDESMPVVEATIGLRAVKASPIEIRILSNSEGRFRLENVPAGKQTIIANKPGYNEATTTITVIPGTETTVHITMIAKAVEEYKIVPLSPIKGQYTCAVEYILASGECDFEVYNQTGQPDIPFQDDNNVSFIVPSGWGGLLFEVDWQTGATPVGMEGIRFQLESQEDIGGMFTKLEGRIKPMRFHINAGEVAPDATLGYPIPQRGVGTWIHVLPLGTGEGQTCAVQCGYGVGVAVQMTFTIQVTIFYGGPVDPAYSALET